MNADQEFDDLLRDLGPDVPQPDLDDGARARLMAAIDDAPVAARVRTPRWAKPAAAAAAILAVTCTLLWVYTGRVVDELDAARADTEEALQLLVRARRTQPTIPVPADLEGVRKSDLALVTFHHDLCPIARVATPGFAALEQQHRGDAATFVTLDVTGARRDEADREIDALGLRYALLGPLGAETGVVKVIDTAHHRVLCSAPGALGLQQAEQLLARVSG